MGRGDDPLALPQETDPYAICRRLDEHKGRSGWMRKISPSPGFDPRTVQPVACRYTEVVAYFRNICTVFVDILQEVAEIVC
jgi:hypothetical protein